MEEVIQGMVLSVDHIGTPSDPLRILAPHEVAIVALRLADASKREFFISSEEVNFQEGDYVRALCKGPERSHDAVPQIKWQGEARLPSKN